MISPAIPSGSRAVTRIVIDGHEALDEGAARIDQMLAVVEDDEGAASRKELNSHAVKIVPVGLGQVHRLGSGGQYQIWIGNRRQVDEPNPVWPQTQ